MRTLRRSWLPGVAAAGALALFGCGEDGPSNTNSNHNPVIQTVTVDPDTTLRLDTVLVTVVASDVDGDLLTHNYKPNAGSVVGSGAEIGWIVPDQVGDFSLLASVTDGRGGVDSWTAIVTVIDLPTGIRGSAAVTGGTASLVGARLALYTDPEDWPDNPFYFELVPEDAPTAYSFTISPLPPGTYYLDVWKDLNGNQVVDNADLHGFYGNGALPDPEFGPIPVIQNHLRDIGSIQVS